MTDPLVIELRGEDPDVAPPVPKDVILLTGYLGPQEGDGDGAFHRLYPEPDLRTYLKVPASAIKHRKEIDENTDFGARSALYVDEDFMYSTPEYGDSDFLSTLRDTGLHVPRIMLEHAALVTILETVALTTTTKRCSTPKCMLRDDAAA